MPYTFNKTQYGTIEVFENGQRIATTTPSYAAQQYGYGAVAPAPVTNPLAPVIPPQTTVTPQITPESIQAGINAITGGVQDVTKKLNEYGATITPSILGKPETPIQVPTVQPSSAANVLVTGAESTSKSIQDYINTLTSPPSEGQTTYDALMKEVTGMMGEAGGRGAAQLEAEAAGGVPGLKTSLANINAEMLRKIAEYKSLSTQIEGKPITMQSIVGAQAQVQKVMASDIGLLQAQALGLQGQLSAAQDTADKSVNLKYQDTQDAINIRLQQLQLLEGQLSKNEQIRADAIKLYLQDSQQQLADQKAAEKQKNSTLLSWMSDYRDAGITLNDTIESAQQKIITKSATYKAEIAPKERIDTTGTGVSSSIEGWANLLSRGQGTIANVPTNIRNDVVDYLNTQNIDITKQLSDTAVKEITQTESALSSLEDLRMVIQNNLQFVGPIAGLAKFNPWSDARKAQADIDRVRQTVGKALEGGVLRKEDEEKYKKILATLGDTPETALYKIDSLKSTLERDLQNYKETQLSAGRYVESKQESTLTSEKARQLFNY